MRKERRACFTGDTEVIVGLDAEGNAITRRISDLREGDYVLAVDENDPDGEPVLKRITKVWIKTTTQLRVLARKVEHPGLGGGGMNCPIPNARGPAHNPLNHPVAVVRRCILPPA